MNKTLPFCLIILLTAGLSCSKNAGKPEDVWIDLFNGKDLNDWTIKIAGHETGDNYKNTFRVEEGVLKVSYDDYDAFDDKFGHIFYKQKFSNYVIKVEYRFTGKQVTSGASWTYRNSGIMFHSQSPHSMSKWQHFPVSIEAQMLGGNGVDERPTGNVCTPGTNIVINENLILDHCINSSSKTYHGDQWITMEVEVHGNSNVKHIVNSEVVLEYEQPQLDDRDSTAISLQTDKMLSEGYIALQAESHPIEFRSVKIRILDN